VLAVTAAEELVVVHQFRPAIEQWTLELSSGPPAQSENPRRLI
jgi:hypothetical protein